MCPPGYHHNGFEATHVLGHMIDNSSYTTTCHNAIVAMTGRAYWFYDYILYATPILLL